MWRPCAARVISSKQEFFLEKKNQKTFASFFYQRSASLISILDPRFVSCVLPNAPLITLAEGLAWAEGPVWFADANHLLFSDLPNDRIMRWTEHGGVSLFRQPSHFTNGQTRDRQGRLIGCSHRGRCITRTELDGTLRILAGSFEGRRLNGPNDVVVSRDGAIWFTDPHYGGSTDYEGGKHRMDLPPRVYRLARDGTLSVMAEDIAGPNGLCFSPDETLLYVAESGPPFDAQAERHIRVFDLREGLLRNGRIFHRISPGFADGLRCDQDGRIWSSAGDGVHCIHPDGILLGKILTGCTVSNIAFGGRARSRLFICASHALMAVYTNVRGAQRP
jgi:gluconolactonase